MTLKLLLVYLLGGHAVGFCFVVSLEILYIDKSHVAIWTLVRAPVARYMITLMVSRIC